MLHAELLLLLLLLLLYFFEKVLHAELGSSKFQIKYKESIHS